MSLPPRLISAKEAACYVGVSVNTFRSYVRLGRFPKPIQLGARKVYDKKKIDLTLDKLSGIQHDCGIIETSSTMKERIDARIKQNRKT